MLKKLIVVHIYVHNVKEIYLEHETLQFFIIEKRFVQLATV